jgi:hypothetical protein
MKRRARASSTIDTISPAILEKATGLLLHRAISKPAHAERQDNRVKRFGIPCLSGRTGTKRTSTALSCETLAQKSNPLRAI